MKKSLIFNVSVLVLALLLSSCCKTEKVHNSYVKDFISEIKEMEYVKKTEVYKRAFNLYIDIYVEDEFNTGGGSSRILELAKESFNKNVINELKNEFEQEYPPDTDIYIRNKDGDLFTIFHGTCYKDYKRDIPPEFEKYIWQKSE